MKPIDVVKQAEGRTFKDEDGYVEKFQLLPPLSDMELEELESSLPCHIPAEARELFSHCRGFEGVLESLDFSGCEGGFAMEEVIPYGIPIAHDGFGNYWVVDLTMQSTSWGPIFFVCHDAPVVVFQTDSLSHFISEVIRFGNEPWKSEIDDVHEKYHNRIWKENPGVMTYGQCIGSGDKTLADFAHSLDESYLFIDLRKAQLGDGFSWGRYGPLTVNKRCGEERIFAYQVRKSLWQRLFGK